MSDFDSNYADGVDRRSEALHRAAMAALAENGVMDPSEEEYVAALERISDSGILDELPYFQRPAERIAAAAARSRLVHDIAMKNLGDEPTEAEYLDACRAAEAELDRLGVYNPGRRAHHG